MMGKVIHVEFQKSEIEFSEGEFRLDDRGEGLVVYIPLSLAKRRVGEAEAAGNKTDSGDKGASADAETAPVDLDGVNWDHFKAMNLRLVKSGRRKESVILAMRRELAALRDTYGVHALNAGISRIREPRQAQIAYLKTIMKNMKGGRRDDAGVVDQYEKSIESAIENLPQVRQGN